MIDSKGISTKKDSLNNKSNIQESKFKYTCEIDLIRLEIKKIELLQEQDIC